MMQALRPIGFIGLGAMGEPMALNLRKAGVALVVWNRSAGKRDLLAQAGASVAAGSLPELRLHVRQSTAPASAPAGGRVPL